MDSLVELPSIALSPSPMRDTAAAVYKPARCKKRCTRLALTQMQALVVTADVIEAGAVNFLVHNSSNHVDWIQAHGFLRSGQLYVQLADDDNRMRVVCRVIERELTSTFELGEVLGYHLGLTRASDTDRIDQALLIHDSNLRLGVEFVDEDGPDWGALNTRLNCVQLISAMLTKLHDGWEIAFVAGTAEHRLSSAVQDTDQLDAHLERHMSEREAKRNPHIGT